MRLVKLKVASAPRIHPTRTRQRLPNNHGDDVNGIGAERDTDTKLRRALANGKCERAVDADSRQCNRERAEQAEQARAHTPPTRFEVDEIAERLDVDVRKVGAALRIAAAIAAVVVFDDVRLRTRSICGASLRSVAGVSGRKNCESS